MMDGLKMNSKQLKISMIIEIPNRYVNEITRLIPLNECIYEVDFTDNPYPYRLIFEEDNETIKAFDPQGGPFMSIGYKVNNKYKISKIHRDETTKRLLVTLEDI